MIDPKKVYDKANQEYKEYQRRANFNEVRVEELGKKAEFIIKALVEELNKVGEVKSPKSFIDFTKGE